MPGKRKIRYRPNQNEPFPLSRTSVELYLRCPRCFYLATSEKYDISPPSGPMSYIPTAIDRILKSEFNIYRHIQEPHPYLIEREIDAVPFQHDKIEDWQSIFKGIRFHHHDTNLILYGAIDDCWRHTRSEELFIVEYKSTTAKKDKKTGQPIDENLDEKSAPWKYWYKKQVEFYQWLFQNNNFTVSNTAYFLFCSALYQGVSEFKDNLQFKINIVPYQGNYSWVEETIRNIKNVLDSEEIPNSNENCNYCNYVKKINREIN
jgi:hypothetical protein